MQDSNGLLQQQESGASGRDGNGSVAPSLCSDNPPPISTPANATLKGRMPWLFEPGAAEQPWPLVVHAYAHIALCARNDVVAEQAVEEAMRTLHRHVGWWDATTLVATLSCVHETLFAGSHVSCMSSGQPVPLSGVELSRLLSRFQTYLPSLWTLVIAEYGTLGVRGFQKILESPLVLMHLPSVDAMASGVTALHQLGVVLAGQGAAALDEAGWAALAATLRAACSLDSVAVLPAAQRFETVICAQRLSVEMVSHSGRCMPSSVRLAVCLCLFRRLLRFWRGCHLYVGILRCICSTHASDTVTFLKQTIARQQTLSCCRSFPIKKINVLRCCRHGSTASVSVVTSAGRSSLQVTLACSFLEGSVRPLTVQPTSQEAKSAYPPSPTSSQPHHQEELSATAAEVTTNRPSQQHLRSTLTRKISRAHRRMSGRAWRSGPMPRSCYGSSRTTAAIAS
jgi:hypothetical protein